VDDPQTVDLHGRSVCFHRAGSGPALVLIHGITSSAQTWRPVFDRLAERHDVVAPDLQGHGLSAKPRGDYSLGAHASGIRDLLLAIGVDRATVVGHSLGGGVAMQLAYQFPERCERLVLVDSGGLGRGVSALLRAATLPGAELVLPVLAHRVVRDATGIVGRAAGRLGIGPGHKLHGPEDGLAALGDPQSRRAFLNTARSVIEPTGQKVSATDRLYLSAQMPSLIVWGDRDPIIPARHGQRAHGLMPGSRLEVFEGAGHFPFHDDPERFIGLLEEFISSTEPARIDTAAVQRILRAAAG
jgi:pimeloyl-ACP methyl ester carboxylesterase